MDGRNPKRTARKKGGVQPPNNFDYDHTATRNTETNASAPISTRENNRPTLTVVLGADAGRVLPIVSDVTTIGRLTTCDLVLPDPGVSRVHARILRTADGFILEDAGSKNGTFVEAEPVNRRPIKYGGAIQIGPHVLVRLGLMTVEEEGLARELYDSSMRDALTTLYNRRYLFDRLTAELAFQARHKTDLSLVLLDFDHFKLVNDTFGHPGGDKVLQEGAKRILATVRTEDVVARVGGEEFGIFLRGIDPSAAAVCAERIRAAISAAPMPVDGDDNEPTTVTVSLGIASIADCPAPATSEQLFAVADRRLYLAKKQGRNCCCSTG